MLGKVSVQPSVGHWKVLPEQRNGVRESLPARLHRTAPPGAPGAGAAPPVDPQHLPRSPRSCPALCSISWRYRHHQRCPSSKPCFATSQPKEAPSLTLEGLRGSVVDLQVVHQLLHAGEGQFAAIARALVMLPWKETEPLASSPPSLPPPRGRAGLTWDRSALQRPQVLGWGPSAPHQRHRAAGQSRFAATCQGEAAGQQAAPSPSPSLNHGPAALPTLANGVQATAALGASGVEGAGDG